MKIAVIGSGGWGTAIAVLLANQGHNVYLWSWIQEETDRLSRDRENKEFLPGIFFPNNIHCTHDMRRKLLSRYARCRRRRRGYD